MKKFSVKLIEENLAHYFTIDSAGKREFIFKNRIGALQRHYNGGWRSSSREFGSINEARKWLGRDSRRKKGSSKRPEISFNPGKMVRDHQPVIDCLEQLSLADWKIIFTLQENNRNVFEGDGEEKVNHFSHCSILLKLKLEGREDYIEVGEGRTDGCKFNRDALCVRAKSIVFNQRDSRYISFAEKVPVILSSGVGGILIHEILGHSLEADYIFQKLSPISLSDVGRKIVSSGINLLIHDKKDTFFKGIKCDDEGKVPPDIYLIRRGVLRYLISDCFYQRLLETDQSGHARTMDFNHIPIPRMYALYLAAGDYHPDECIESTRFGIYAKEFGEGKVLFHKNTFFFNIEEAYLIERGRLSAPLGNIIVQGNIVEVLNSIEMVANDFRYDTGNSYCFKNGQVLNVRVGQPTIKMNNLMVSLDK